MAKGASLRIIFQTNVHKAMILILIFIVSLPVSRSYLYLDTVSFSLLAQAIDLSESPYLINEPNRKVLRVPYLNQGKTLHCWLYSAGMVITYYGVQFDPDIVLNRLGKGFNAELHSLEWDRFFNVLRELYNIRFIRLSNVRRDENRIKELIVSEISNARPVIMAFRARIYYSKEKIGHTVVITGYIDQGSRFNLTIHDPSGWLFFSVLGAGAEGRGYYRRIDGVEAKDTATTYHVSIDLKELLKSLERIDFLAFVRSSLRPNPPRIVVTPIASTIHPYLTTNKLCDIDTGGFYLGESEFYHNNYLPRSLWYPIPIANRDGSLSLLTYVYPNTNRSSKFTVNIDILGVHRHRQFIQFILIESIKYTVKINSFSDINISCGDRCSAGSNYAAIILELRHYADFILVDIRVVEEQYPQRLVYVWDSFMVYIYDEVAKTSLRITAESFLDIYVGIKYLSESERQVDLYFSYKLHPFLPLEIIHPQECRAILAGERPSRSEGGYYHTCSVVVKNDVKTLNIKISIWRSIWWSSGPVLSVQIPIDITNYCISAAVH